MDDVSHRRPQPRGRWLALALLLGPGCLGGDKVTSATGASGSTSGASATTASTAGTSGTVTATTATDASSGTTGGITATTGPAVCEPVETYGEETTGGAHECNIWLQDCPPCQKCTAWSDMAEWGAAWDELRCVPLVPSPKQAFEPCTVQGPFASGLDDCDEGLFCWDVDQDSVGYCIAFCAGSFDAPECPYPGHCLSNQLFTICHPLCEPLLQDCPDNDSCLPLDGGEWVCLPDGSAPGEGKEGDPCESVNYCDPGLICAEPALVPGCQALGCCATICDLDQPNTCPLKDQGAECVPFYAMGEAPPGKENVGFCGLP
ncbi:MAG: hypothetical protein H6710_17535 [Myxococcales bacterium]|nr:hypothetical protein [Myxococcales bacterium]MCB9701040.1 hypothetical protein [Myxococcales bacterium]